MDRRPGAAVIVVIGGTVGAITWGWAGQWAASVTCPDTGGMREPTYVAAVTFAAALLGALLGALFALKCLVPDPPPREEMRPVPGDGGPPYPG